MGVVSDEVGVVCDGLAVGVGVSGEWVWQGEEPSSAVVTVRCSVMEGMGDDGVWAVMEGE